MANLLHNPPLSLYVHIPWCVRKCPYCDFNSHAAPGDLPGKEYIEALVADLEADLPLVWGRPLQSIYFDVWRSGRTLKLRWKPTPAP
jgi:coproporphyrinogen III oxidase-like Fe-S oxidoreductase